MKKDIKLLMDGLSFKPALTPSQFKIYHKNIDKTIKECEDAFIRLIDEEINEEKNKEDNEIERNWTIINELEFIKRTLKNG